jgi:hypothetical protein
MTDGLGGIGQLSTNDHVDVFGVEIKGSSGKRSVSR